MNTNLIRRVNFTVCVRILRRILCTWAHAQPTIWLCYSLNIDKKKCAYRKVKRERESKEKHTEKNMKNPPEEEMENETNQIEKTLLNS